MKTGVLIFCTKEGASYTHALKKELKDYDVITFSYRQLDGLTKEEEEVEEARARNRALLEMSHFDYLITLDADEFIFKKDADRIKKHLEDTNTSLVLAGRILYADKNSCYAVDSHAPVVGVAPKKVKFYLKRCARAGAGSFLNNVVIHDFSVVGKPLKKEKIVHGNLLVNKVLRSAASKNLSSPKSTKLVRKKKIKGI